MELTSDEQRFIAYWEEERKRKKKFLRKLSFGLPLAVLMVGAVLVNLVSGWYQKADLEIRKHSSVIIVVLVAVIGIVVFITVFSARHKWEMNEQTYLELLAKKNRKPGATESGQ